MADDHHAYPEGLDRAQGGGRQEGRRHLAIASGSAGRNPHQSRAHGRTRDVAAQLCARGTVRRQRRAPAGVARPGPHRSAPDECQPARERRAAAAGPGPAGVPRLRRRRGQAGRRDRRGHQGAGHLPARRDRPKPGPVPIDGPRRDGVEPAVRRVRIDQQGVAGRHRGRRRRSRAGRPGDGGVVGTPVPGLAGGIC